MASIFQDVNVHLKEGVCAQAAQPRSFVLCGQYAEIKRETSRALDDYL